MTVFEFLSTVIIGYLIGSLPFAVWVARTQGVDILKVGSGNPGATNVKRILGKRIGNTVFALDCFKGFAAAIWVQLPILQASDPVLLGIIGLVAAIFGHSYSIFINFKGGKGVATTIGGLFAIMPLAILLAIIVWSVVFVWQRYVSLASLSLAASLPVFAWLTGRSRIEVLFCFIIALYIFIRHRSNIARLIEGTENRFSRK